MSTAKDERRLGPLEGRQALTVQVDGEPVPAFAGESVATVLLAQGRRTLRHTKHGAPRGLFCGMGVCFDCLVTIDGLENVRACLTPVSEAERARGVRRDELDLDALAAPGVGGAERGGHHRAQQPVLAEETADLFRAGDRVVFVPRHRPQVTLAANG